MKACFLALIGGQLFGLEKHNIAGIGVRDDRRVRPVERQGRLYIALPNGEQALICDLFQAMGVEESRIFKRSHYLIVTNEGQFLALAMTGKGRLLTVDVAAQTLLPPAFTGFSRDLVAGIVPNGNDAIVLLNVAALFKAPDYMLGSQHGAGK